MNSFSHPKLYLWISILGIFIMVLGWGLSSVPETWPSQLKPFYHRPASGSVRMVLQQKIPINHARAEDLTVLPGIGPGRANQIIRFRNENGPFKSLTELSRLNGIGPVTMEKIFPFLSIEEVLSE